ncbi:PH domain-containing protein [Haloarcula brevis]|uniref:PH domain-containing protein n=1 Tax=Haloarcula brevis TaxID=3111453 RepID=UPI00300ECB04
MAIGSPTTRSNRRGVFFQQQTTVPYNRITNVGISQGPIERLVDTGAVGIHTAGYGGQMGAELTISGVSDFEDIQDQILERVRERPAKATETEELAAVVPAEEVGADDPDAMLGELRRIRELLEQGRSIE